MFHNAIQVDYNTIKSVVMSRNLSIQYIDILNSYYTLAIDGSFAVACIISKENSTDCADFETNLKPFGNKSQGLSPPFASKTIGSKKLYKRVTGARYNLVAGIQDLNYSITFPWAKITGIEVVGGQFGDTCSFFVLDTNSGTFSGISNQVLNQFAFNVNIAQDFFCSTSQFDADLYQGMHIRIMYTSVSDKNIGINFILDEVK